MRIGLGPLHSAVRFIQEMSFAVGQHLTVGQARHLQHCGTRQIRLTCASLNRMPCSAIFIQAQTDIAAVRSAVEWAWHLRVMITGADAPLSPAQIKVADSAVPVRNLAAAAEAWQPAGVSALPNCQRPRSHLAPGVAPRLRSNFVLDQSPLRIKP
jgi:hypothetical protein